MESSIIPIQNYIGLLQQTCAKNNISMPQYLEDPVACSNKEFKWICKVGEWKTECIGFSKKIAKQNAAQAMVLKIENENLLKKEELKGNNKMNAISMLYEYSMKEKKSEPLFSDKGKDDAIFEVSCTLDGFTCVGRGHSRKTAKENAAELIVQHFDITKYFSELKTLEMRVKKFKNPIQVLYELCQEKQLFPKFKEEKLNLRKKEDAYVVSCSVGELEVKSAKNSSKKQAKIEAADLMLTLLRISTPTLSPIVVNEGKRKLSECNEVESLSENYQEKRVKVDESSSEDE